MPAGKKNVQGSNNSTTFAKQAALQTNKTENNLTHKSTPRNDVLLESLTKEQLKAECRKRGRKTSGNKADLLQRLGYNKMQRTNTEQLHRTETEPNGATFKTPPKTNANQAKTNSLVIWKSPILTTKYAILEIISLLQCYGKRLIQQRKLMVALATLIIVVTTLCLVPGSHQQIIKLVKSKGIFIIYWTGLGVLSSVGLGTGLHTFLLYLGPHIASVTLAAYECNSLDFPEPPYPNEIVCPEEEVISTAYPSMWAIMSKVRFEAFLWGAGTALGELPPYFMAKASRLSGAEHEDFDDIKELEDRKKHGDKLNLFERGKLAMEKFVEKVGFLGILLCASIPNPLFDLAGITCGHFLVPFWTFFGATLIGKAIVKMHIQKIFVIIAFNEILVEKAVDFMALVPVIGKKLQMPFKAFLQNQKDRLHRGTSKVAHSSPNIIQNLFEYFVIFMVLFFVSSIFNSLAQSYQKKLNSQKKTKGHK
uniref:Putative secreted protein n=1 Tax=Aedes albopictus TaxID=7160 RepID=A0A023EV67_AEDAL